MDEIQESMEGATLRETIVRRCLKDHRSEERTWNWKKNDGSSHSKKNPCKHIKRFF
jgi:hypothetical protein